MTAAEYNRNLPHPGIYAQSWTKLATLPPDMDVSVPGWVIGYPGWGNMPMNAGEVLRRVRVAANNRINARAGFTPREPREGTTELRRDADRVRDILTRRLRVYQFETKTARKRFSHLLASNDD